MNAELVPADANLSSAEERSTGLMDNFALHPLGTHVAHLKDGATKLFDYAENARQCVVRSAHCEVGIHPLSSSDLGRTAPLDRPLGPAYRSQTETLLPVPLPGPADGRESAVQKGFMAPGARPVESTRTRGAFARTRHGYPCGVMRSADPAPAVLPRRSGPPGPLPPKGRRAIFKAVMKSALRGLSPTPLVTCANTRTSGSTGGPRRPGSFFRSIDENQRRSHAVRHAIRRKRT